MPRTELEDKLNVTSSFVQRFSYPLPPDFLQEKFGGLPFSISLLKLQMQNMSETDPRKIPTWEVKLWHEAVKNVLARIWYGPGAKFRHHDSVVLAVGQVRITPEKLAAVLHHPILNFKLMHKCHAIKPVVKPSFGEEKSRLKEEKVLCKDYPTYSKHPLSFLDDQKIPISVYSCTQSLQQILKTVILAKVLFLNC